MEFSPRRRAMEEIGAAIQGEAEWRRVKNFIAFLHTGQHTLFQYYYIVVV